MKKIPLTQGKFALVDDEDFKWLNQWKWQYSNSGRAVRSSPKINGKRNTILMHRDINKTPPGFETDHRDNDPLNNQRQNLRDSTRQQNCFNRSLNSNSSSGKKGVTWNKKLQKWQVQSSINGIKKYLGLYVDLKEAAKAYDSFAKNNYSEFAKPNFP